MLLAAFFVSLVLSQPVASAVARAEFEVYYHHVVRNRTDAELRDVKVYLPVPQSDEYQQVEGFRVERNTSVHISNRTDAFGTRMKRVAIASIPPRGEAHVGFSCTVALAAPVKVALDPTKAAEPDALERLPDGVRGLYLRDHHIFGLQTPAIQMAVGKLLKSHPNPVRRARAIHDLVASTIRYNGDGGWDPAPAVLERKSGSCSEFTYLFCALCRATGIPTRFVGASIFPARSRTPFQDHGHHRWAQAYLPGHGWVDFDPTLDAGRPAKQGFVGTHHGRTLVVTRTGDKSLQLGLSYVGANSHSGQTTRARWFTWSQGTLARFDEAKRLFDAGERKRAEAILRDLVEKQPGTRAAQEAAAILGGGTAGEPPDTPDAPEAPDEPGAAEPDDGGGDTDPP